MAYITDMTMQKKVMTKKKRKRSSDFWLGKVHPLRENHGYAYVYGNVPIIRGSDNPKVRVRVRVRTLGLSDPRINGPSDCRPIIFEKRRL